jgi:hypothetical protein
MTDDMIKQMATRFLSWKLPEDFCPDNGISFEPEFNAEHMAKQGKPPMRRDPIGTNLFNATQAEAMVRHLVEGLPSIDAAMALVPEGWNGSIDWIGRKCGAVLNKTPFAENAVIADAETLAAALRDAALKAQANEARRAETQGGSVHESAVAESDAPETRQDIP